MFKRTLVYRAAAFAIFVLASVGLIGCDEAPTPEALKAAEWLRNFYIGTPVGGGWRLSSITPKGRQVYVEFKVPARQATALMRLDTPVQVASVASIGCPNVYAAIWQIIEPRDVTIETEFALAQCYHAQ